MVCLELNEGFSIYLDIDVNTFVPNITLRSENAYLRPRRCEFLFVFYFFCNRTDHEQYLLKFVLSVFPLLKTVTKMLKTIMIGFRSRKYITNGDYSKKIRDSDMPFVSLSASWLRYHVVDDF